MDNIVVISQNVKLASLSKVRPYMDLRGDTLFVTTQFIFDNEREEIFQALGQKCEIIDFSEILNDTEREECDKEAFNPKIQKDVFQYYDDIKTLKNQKIVNKLLMKYNPSHRIIVCDDLGIDEAVWLANDFIKIECDYYHYKSEGKEKKNFLERVVARTLQLLQLPQKPIYEAFKDGSRYLFYGSLNRIGYRLDLDFHPASKIELLKYKLLRKGIAFNDNTIRLSTLHEGYGVLPDKPNMNFKIIQDGFLPENYSSNYLYFYGHKYVEFYTWDTLGRLTFFYHQLNSRIIPFRRKLYIPTPKYPKKIKKVLCVASGAGDWTAVKNRSDEDKMIVAFGKVAKMFPDIDFVYRCHPVWIHPLHQGVNSINRAAEYIHWLNLPNLRISANIPNAIKEGKFILSYKRTSFEEDLNDVDIVFGEHSISMIDAAFKQIIFASVNVTGHRDFFKGITDLGFPHCESVNEIVALLKNLTTPKFKMSYEQAIMRYNEMTDKEE